MFDGGQQYITGGNFISADNGNINLNLDMRGQSHTLNNVTQGYITNIYGQTLQGFDRLLEHVATGAFHNSGDVCDPPKCHPGTRVAILETLYAWAAALAYVFTVRWVYGPAGAGKSAIMRTLAEMLEKQGLLLATFFFFRASSNRNSTQFFIPTIAYQICLAIPAVRPLVESAVEAQPLIFSRSLEAQAQLLIVNPLRYLHETGALPPRYPRILIIDGLDECADPDRQIEVLQTLIMLLSELPISFAILIASRPEPHIKAGFDNGELNQLSSRLVLDNKYEPDADIRKFFQDKFLDICATHRLRLYLPNPWPLPATLNLLVKQASGQFIFASTVIKFVEPSRHNPAERLEIIMCPHSQQPKQKPFEQLDALYSTILGAIPPDMLSEVLHILGVILVPHLTKLEFNAFTNGFELGNGIGPRSPHFFALLLGTTTSAIRQHLYDLESLLQIRGDREHIQIFHASFADFIFDKFRSGRFYINPGMVHEEMCQKCVQFLFSADLYDLGQYILCNVQYHFQQATPTPELLGVIEDCDINTAPFDNRHLHQLFPQFLDGVQASKFHNSSEVHSWLMIKYKQFISQRVDLYFERGLSYLLPFISDNYCATHCALIIKLARGISLADLLSVPDDALDLVNSDGSGLPALNAWENMFLLPRILVKEILGERIHSCYAQFALRFLKAIVHPRSEESHTIETRDLFQTTEAEAYVSEEDSNVDSLSEEEMYANSAAHLESVMSMAAPQVELVELIQKNSLDHDLKHRSQFESILGKYVQRTQEYFRSQVEHPTNDSQVSSIDNYGSVDPGSRPASPEGSGSSRGSPPRKKRKTEQ